MSASAEEMSLLEELAILVSQIVREHRLSLRESFIGFRYAITIVEGALGREAGLAYVDYLDAFSFSEARDYPNPDNIAELLTSMNMLEKIIGLSYANAVSQYALWRLGYADRFHIEEGNLIKVVKDLASDRGCIKALVVGNMPPIVTALSEICESVTVVERSPFLRTRNSVVDTMIGRASRGTDIAVITGATVVNETVEYVLSYLREAKLRIVVGPTAGLYPELFFKRGVDYVASLRVVDIDRALKKLRLGGGRWSIADCCRDYVASPKH